MFYFARTTSFRNFDGRAKLIENKKQYWEAFFD